jgi:hypothetical protein
LIGNGIYRAITLFALTCVAVMPVDVTGQKSKFRENVAGYYDKSDSLPFFMFEKAELDTFISMNTLMPLEAEQLGVKCDVEVGFTVDGRKKISSVKCYKVDLHLPRNIQFRDYAYYDTVKKFFIAESERLIKLTDGLWYSDSTLEKKELKYRIRFENEAFDRFNKNPAFSNVNRMQVGYPYHAHVFETGPALGKPVSLLAKADLINYGVRKYNVRKLVLARTYFQEYVKYLPGDANGHFNLGLCYYKLKDQKNACHAWKKCGGLADEKTIELISKYCNQ